MSGDIGGWAIFFFGAAALGIICVASVITAIVTGYRYFQENEDLGWFISSIVTLSLYIIVPIIIAIVFQVRENRRLKNQEES